MNHAEQPRLCDDCLAAALTLAEMGPPQDRVIKACYCRGPDAVVIAVASKNRGQIVNWHIEGPMSEDQAGVVGASILATFAKAGMRIRDEIVKQ